MALLSPSILSAHFCHLGRDVDRVLQAGADMVSIVDVMDGHFVPNISIGVPVVQSLRRHTDAFLDVHLMISQPEKYIEAFSKAGADLINIHLRGRGGYTPPCSGKSGASDSQAALTIKPATPAEAVFPYLSLVDMVLVMSVEPGFGGRSYTPKPANS